MNCTDTISDSTMTLDPIATSTTRVGLVCDTLRARIESRALVKGARLPSVRRLSEELAVSKSTVVEAYDRLAAEGLVESRRGSGFYVAAAPEPFVLAEAPRLDPAVDLLAIVRAAMEERPEEVQPASGWLPEEWLPSEGVDRSVRAVLRGSSKNKLRYNSPFGYEPLRRLIAARMGERGIPVDPARIVLADSTTQALDLALRFHVCAGRPGGRRRSPLFQSRPTHRRAPRRTRRRSLHARGPGSGGVGAHFRRAPASRLYRACRGRTIRPARRSQRATAHRVLTLAEKYDVVVVEDDVYGDFEANPESAAGRIRRVFARDLRRRLHQDGLGSVAGKLLDRPARLDGGDRRSETRDDARQQRVCCRGGPRLSRRGRISPPSRVGCARLAHATTHALDRLKALGLKPWVEPRAGIFIWAELPDGLDAADVARVRAARSRRVRARPHVLCVAAMAWLHAL